MTFSLFLPPHCSPTSLNRRARALACLRGFPSRKAREHLARPFSRSHRMEERDVEKAYTYVRYVCGREKSELLL